MSSGSERRRTRPPERDTHVSRAGRLSFAREATHDRPSNMGESIHRARSDRGGEEARRYRPGRGRSLTLSAFSTRCTAPKLELS